MSRNLDIPLQYAILMMSTGIHKKLTMKNNVCRQNGGIVWKNKNRVSLA